MHFLSKSTQKYIKYFFYQGQGLLLQESQHPTQAFTRSLPIFPFLLHLLFGLLATQVQSLFLNTQFELSPSHGGVVAQGWPIQAARHASQAFTSSPFVSPSFLHLFRAFLPATQSQPTSLPLPPC